MTPGPSSDAQLGAVTERRSGVERRSGFDRRDGVERRLLDDRERFVAFAFAGADMLLEVGAAGHVTFAAGAFRTRLGCEPGTLVGRPADSVVAAEDRPAFATCLALLAARGRIAPTALRLADGSRTPYVLSGLSRPGPDGAFLHCLSLGVPPGPLPVTAPALCSATVLGREAEARLRAAHGPGAAPTAAALDVFEVVASGSPPDAGKIAAALLDQAGAGTLAGELAPGRFGLLHAPGLALGDVPDLLAIVADLEKSLHLRGIEAEITPVKRLTLARDETAEVNPLQAVRALRCALSAFARGGASALVEAGFKDGLTGFVRVTTARTAALRRALAERRFCLAFQPIVRLDTGAVHHYEALLRPERRSGEPGDGPGDMVTMAEMVGLTEELDWAVFETAREAAGQSGTAIAFNLSGLSVQSPAFRDRLLRALDRPLPRGGGRLLAEITETAEIEDETTAAQTVEGLRGRGVPVCIDDFGAGAAAFHYLRRFQVDHVKIDGSYVRQAAESERDRGFVAAMIDLSLTVGAHTIAEHIETEAVADTMRSLGVRYGQGWLFGRPGDLPTPKAAARRCGEAREQWA